MNIVILGRAQNDTSPTCSFIHDQAINYSKLGHNVIEISTIPYIPFMKYIRPEKYKRFKEYKGIKKVDGVTIIYIKKVSLSTFVSQKWNGFLTYIAIKGIIKKLLKARKIDILHAHMLEQEGYAGYLIKKKYHIHTVVTTHGTDCFRYFEPYPENYLRQTVLGVDIVIAVSNQLKTEIESKISNANIETIYNGTSVNINDISENNLHNKMKYSIISVGTFFKRKNFDLTIKSFKIINSIFQESRLTIVGEGPEYDNLKTLVKELNLTDKVFFTGRILNEKVIELMKKHEIFLMPSEKEGFGIVYLEAMQCGCIPISLKEAGISDLITDDWNGILLNKPNVNEIVNRITSLFKVNNITEIRNNCFNSAKKYTWKKNAREYITLFESILKNGSEDN